MKPLHYFQFLPWSLMTKLAASSNNPKKKALLFQAVMKAGEPQIDFPRRRRGKRNTFSFENSMKTEPIKPTYKHIRLKYQKEEEINRKDKEAGPVVGYGDYVPKFVELRPRKKKVENKPDVGQCSRTVVERKGNYVNGVSLSLSRKEIEDDFLRMTGKLPPRNPKKRRFTVQRSMKLLMQLGMWLKYVSPAAYAPKTEEKEQKKKKKRSQQ